jgi:hypothetical protein
MRPLNHEPLLAKKELIVCGKNYRATVIQSRLEWPHAELSKCMNVNQVEPIRFEE